MDIIVDFKKLFSFALCLVHFFRFSPLFHFFVLGSVIHWRCTRCFSFALQMCSPPFPTLLWAPPSLLPLQAVYSGLPQQAPLLSGFWLDSANERHSRTLRTGKEWGQGMYSLSSFPAPAPTLCQGPQLQAGIPLHSPSSLVLVTAPSPCFGRLRGDKALALPGIPQVLNCPLLVFFLMSLWMISLLNSPWWSIWSAVCLLLRPWPLQRFSFLKI